MDPLLFFVCVVLLPYLWQDIRVGKQYEQTHEKTPKMEKKASLTHILGQDFNADSQHDTFSFKVQKDSRVALLPYLWQDNRANTWKDSKNGEKGESA